MIFTVNLKKHHRKPSRFNIYKNQLHCTVSYWYCLLYQEIKYIFQCVISTLWTVLIPQKGVILVLLNLNMFKVAKSNALILGNNNNHVVFFCLFLTNQVNHYYYHLALSNEILLHQSNCCTLCGSFFVTLILGPVVQCSPGDVFTGV